MNFGVMYAVYFVLLSLGFFMRAAVDRSLASACSGIFAAGVAGFAAGWAAS